MARTALAVQTIPRNSGAQLTSVTPDQPNGNKFPNDGRTTLVVHNGDGSSHSVTIGSVPDQNGRSGDLVVPIAAGERAILGPFDTGLWNQADGSVNVDVTASTSMKVAVRSVGV